MGYTIEAHRKKGLMQVVLTHLSDQVLKASPERATCGFVVLGNHASVAMMNSLGFQQCPEYSVWLGWSRQQMSSL
jgi:predicted GNAT family acetyltransferase